MVVVPAGSYTMGAAVSETAREKVPEEIGRRERPQHKIAIKNAFAVGKFPVTRREFEFFAKETGFKGPGCMGFDEENGKWIVDPNRDWWEPGYSQDERHPVVCLSWNDVGRYIKWLSEKTGKEYRLLAEAEWEYAARAGSSKPRYWDDASDRQCEFANGADASLKKRIGWNTSACDDENIYTSPVGSFTPNDFGLYDMLGNVLQWTADCWNESYTRAPTDGKPWLAGDCSKHALRGGSWSSEPRSLRAAARDRLHSTNRTINSGFRVARPYP